MSKRIQVFGIDIDNYTVREMMLLLDEYISTDGLNVVEIITPELLLLAFENEQLRNIIKDVNLHIIGDTAILEVLPECNEQQFFEIQKKELEEQFLRSLIRKKKTVYWMCSSDEGLEIVREYIDDNYKDLNIAGYFVGNIEEENTDSIINEVNSAAPDVIIMSLPSPLQENFVFQNRNRFNARLCLCMGIHSKTKYPTKRKNSKIKTLIDQTLFKRKILKYASDNEKKE